MIGDTIRFTHLYPFRFRIVGRTNQFINLTGEELMVENAESALRRTCTHMNIHVVEYTVAPSFPKENETAAHEWFIEFENLPEDECIFIAAIEQSMRSQNAYYDDLIKGNVLQSLKIRKVAKNGFQNYMKSIGKLGGQNKIPRLSNDRSIVDQLEVL
jgi:hypothetical protein